MTRGTEMMLDYVGPLIFACRSTAPPSGGKLASLAHRQHRGLWIPMLLQNI